MIKIITEDFNPEIFNLVAAHPMQSWQWGEARKQMGIEILRLGEFDEVKLKHVFTITFHKVPYTSFSIGYLPRSVMPLKEVLEMLFEEGKKRKAIFIKIEPYATKSQVTSNPLRPFSEASKIQETNNEKGIFQTSNPRFKITKSSHPLFPDWTQVIDLTKTEEELLTAMKPKTRYNIKVAQKHGVLIREMTSAEGFEIFAKLYFDTTARQKYRGHNKTYHEFIFETLQKEISHILVAFYNNKPLSAYQLFLFNDILYYPYGGSSQENREVMAANLLMWEAIRFGKAHGARSFDLWGSLPPYFDRNSDWAGFTRFKEGFGGEFVEFSGSYDLVINPGIYPLYNLADKLRRKFL